MKKWNFLMAAIIIAIGLLVISSCEKEDAGPTITWKGSATYTSSDVTIVDGQSILIGVTAFKSTTSNRKLTKFTLASIANHSTFPLIDSTLNHDTFTGDWNISYSNVGVSRLVAKVEADGGLIAEVSFIVTVNSSGVTVKKKSNVALGSFNDTEFGSFYNTADEAVYLIGPAGTNATKVDLVFFKGATSLNTIASPDDATAQSTFAAISGWSTKNQTRFNTSTITVAQFNVIGSVYKFPDFNTANSLTRINQLAENQVFMFKTQAGKLGLVKVVTLYRGDKIKMDVIVQQ